MVKTRTLKRAADLPEGTEAPTRLDPLTGQPLPARGAKFGNQPCYDLEGNRYPSLAERAIHLAFIKSYAAGKCSEPKRGKYEFTYDGVKIGSYTSDIEFTALEDFYVDTPADRYEFKAGQSYVIDVKSPGTETQATRLRFRLMLAFHKIDVMVVLTRRPKPKKSRAKKG